MDDIWKILAESGTTAVLVFILSQLWNAYQKSVDGRISDFQEREDKQSVVDEKMPKDK